ncbi:Myosin-15 [Manis javanica]|nr:Myosin-15 [Manis javanica]
MALKNWPWMRLFFKIKPPVKSATMGKEIAGLKNECVQVQKALEKLKFQRAKQVSLIREKNDLLFSCQLPCATVSPDIPKTKEQETLANVEEQCESLIKSKIQLEARVRVLPVQVEEEEEINSELTARGQKLEDECSELKKEIDDLETILVKSEKEKRATGHKPSNGNSYEAASIFFSQVKNMTEEVESVNDNGKLNRAAKIIQETHRQTLDDLPREEEELSNLSQAKLKSEQQVDKLEPGILTHSLRVPLSRRRKQE